MCLRTSTNTPIHILYIEKRAKTNVAFAVVLLSSASWSSWQLWHLFYKAEEHIDFHFAVSAVSVIDSIQILFFPCHPITVRLAYLFVYY